MSLRNRFRMVLALAAASLVALAVAWIWNERQHLFEERKGKAQALVDSAAAVLGEFHAQEQQGVLTHSEAQKLALETLQKMRYDETNYFWVHDRKLTMVMHPYHSELNGRSVADYRDPAGNALFREMNDMVATRGSGFVAYQWPHP